MINAGQRILEICNDRDVTLKAVCEAAGIRYGTLHTQISKGREVPFSTVEAIATELGLPLEAFSSKRSAIAIEAIKAAKSNFGNRLNSDLRRQDIEALRDGDPISTDMVLNWLMREKSILRNFGALRDKVDLFYPVQDGDAVPQPAHLGSDSLATIFFELEGIDDYRDKIAKFDAPILRDILETHVEVHRTSQYRVDDVEISVQIGANQVAGKYRRVLAPVVDPEGERFTLVFARLIHAFQQRPHGGSDRVGKPSASGSFSARRVPGPST